VEHHKAWDPPSVETVHENRVFISINAYLWKREEENEREKKRTKEWKMEEKGTRIKEGNWPLIMTIILS
jgi:hypothetical protein